MQNELMLIRSRILNTIKCGFPKFCYPVIGLTAHDFQMSTLRIEDRGRGRKNSMQRCREFLKNSLLRT